MLQIKKIYLAFNVLYKKDIRQDNYYSEHSKYEIIRFLKTNFDKYNYRD